MNYTKDQNRWFEKDTYGVSRKDKLYTRQKIIQIIREYFYKENFFEAEVPVLVSGTTPDTYIQSFCVGDKYLTTSTEYHIKRLIAGGFDKVYTLTKNFREKEFDVLHNPEFSMIEWARVGAVLEDIEKDVKNFIINIFNVLYPQQEFLKYKHHTIKLSHDAWQELTFQEIFKKFYNIDIPEQFVVKQIVDLAKKAGIQSDFQDDAPFLLSELLDNAMKQLGFDCPVLIKKWPSSMTTSAEVNKDNVYWTTRTEIIIAGIEIADGFPFLCDFKKQKYSFQKSLLLREKEGLPLCTLDKKYLDMLKGGLPKGAGMALGIDRLCMLFTNSNNIRDVLCFSWDEL